MRNIIDINSDWIVSTENKDKQQFVHKRILPLNKEEEYCYYLEFISAAPSVEIFFNQEKIGTHHGTFTLFRIDVTDYVVNGDNELDIACEKDFPCQYASLIIVGKEHFALDHYGDFGLTVTPLEITPSLARIRICASAANLPENAMISYTVLTTTGTMLTNKNIAASSPEYICQLTNPCLWNGKTSPKLYIAVAGLIIDGVTVDQVVLPFGLRNVSMQSDKNIMVNGMCVPSNNLLTTLEADPFVYDDMDEAGAYVCVDFTELCTASKDETDCKKQLTEYIYQNYFHPSILCWKLPEEYAEFSELIRSLDFTRPVLF